MPGDNEASSSLGDLIDLQIRETGPMSIATYMALCLTHPTHGYYMRRDPLGVAGDFTTAPEISQIFGELIGFWLVNAWQQLGEPPAFTLLELGPGRGTLMTDVLRVAGRAEGFLDAMHLQLFEASPSLRQAQAERLRQFNPYWPGAVDEVGPEPLLVIANEFFDALPLRQFVKRDDEWHERLVGLGPEGRKYGLSPSTLPDGALPPAIKAASEGEVFEINLSAAEIMRKLSEIIVRQRGAMLVIDYGYDRTQPGDTFQAVEQHRFVDPLANPGRADLTAHVNFEALRTVAHRAGADVHPLQSQGSFLRVLGASERLDALSAANASQADSLQAGLNRLMAPDQMGELFKVLAISSAKLIPLGFGNEARQ